MLNRALRKLPDVTATVTRGTRLMPEVLATHALGARLTYSAYTSTSRSEIGAKIFGNHRHQFLIRSKRGKDEDPLTAASPQTWVTFDTARIHTSIRVHRQARNLNHFEERGTISCVAQYSWSR